MFSLTPLTIVIMAAIAVVVAVVFILGVRKELQPPKEDKGKE